MSDNLVTIYMNYKISRLVEYGMLIMHSSDLFLKEVLEKYLKNYVNSCYYFIFDTVNSKIYNEKIMLEEIEGKRLEILDELSNYELIDSNDLYTRKCGYINTSSKIIPFLINIDLLRFNDKDELNVKLSELIDKNSFIKNLIGNDFIKLSVAINKTNDNLTTFFAKKDNFFSLDYPLFKDRENYVLVKLSNDVKVLEDNYKKSLVERVYRDKKIQDKKLDLLIKKFIKDLLFNVYNENKLYDKYFIELPSDIFLDKKLLESFLIMLNNPLIKRYVTLAICSDNYYSNQALIRKFGYSIACIQDFSHINDIDTKLTNLDNSNLFDFIIVRTFKDKDYDAFLKYVRVNLCDILFDRE